MPKTKSKFKFSLLGTLLILLIPVLLYAALTQTNLLGKAFSPTPIAINVLQNSSFETDSDNNRIPDSWDWKGPRLSKGLGRQCPQPDAGTCYFLMSTTNISRKDDVRLSQNITSVVKKDQNYNLSFYAKTDSRSARRRLNVSLVFTKSDGTIIQEQGSDFLITGTDFTEQKFTFTQPISNTLTQPTPSSSFTQASFLFRYYGNQGKLFLDKVSLSLISPSPQPTLYPTPTDCSNLLKDIYYTTSSSCDTTQALTANFVCKNDYSGQVGDGITCITKDNLKQGAYKTCASKMGCLTPIPYPTPGTCVSTIKSLAYAAEEGACTPDSAQYGYYTCQDNYAGQVGDGTCKSVAEIDSLAQSRCASPHTCPVPSTPTPTPTPPPSI